MKNKLILEDLKASTINIKNFLIDYFGKQYVVKSENDLFERINVETDAILYLVHCLTTRGKESEVNNE
jgi:hypothetical protein